MSDPIRKTVEHYPADRLPAELRPELQGAARVTVSVTEEKESASPSPGLRPKYLSLWAAAAHKDTSVADAVTRIRKLRDEW